MHLLIKKYICYLVIIPILWLVVACSPEFSYSLKSFFFDGAPNPYVLEAIKIQDSLLVQDSALWDNRKLKVNMIPVYNIHEPFKSRKCQNCHDKFRLTRLSQPVPQLCYGCHDDFNDKYEVLHGPTAAGACLECHNPHKSKNEFLLLTTGQDVCLTCHDNNFNINDANHAEVGEQLCTECHNPHGGKNNGFLLN